MNSGTKKNSKPFTKNELKELLEEVPVESESEDYSESFSELTPDNEKDEDETELNKESAAIYSLVRIFIFFKKTDSKISYLLRMPINIYQI